MNCFANIFNETEAATYCATDCSSLCQGICADADLSGIGVRLGFYANALANGEWLILTSTSSDVILFGLGSLHAGQFHPVLLVVFSDSAKDSAQGECDDPSRDAVY